MEGGRVATIEELMRELVRSSVALKRTLYQRDDGASTTPEETDGPRTTVHLCRLCKRAAAGAEAQVRHKSECPLARLQRAQKALHASWPELFVGNGTVKRRPAAVASKRADVQELAEAGRG